MDVGAGHHVFYGDSAVMDRWPKWPPLALPLAEGARVLTNRVVSLLEAYREKFRTSPPTADEAVFLALQTARAAHAVTDALLIRRGAYVSHYTRRLAALRATYPERTELADLVSLATRFRLAPTRPPDFDVVGFWDAVASQYAATLDEVLMECLSGRSGLRSTWPDVRQRYASPFAAWNRRECLKDLARRARGRPAVARQRRELELAGMELIRARRSASVVDPDAVAEARTRLRASGARAADRSASVDGARTAAADWESLRTELVTRWYTIRH
jgi:hypothetical protein